MRRREVITGLLGLSTAAQGKKGPVGGSSGAVICQHQTRRGGQVWLVRTTPGTGPDESEYGKAWLGVEWCINCGALFLPEEWRQRRS